MSFKQFKQYDRLNKIPPFAREDIAQIVNSPEYLIYYGWLEILEVSCLGRGYKPCYIVAYSGLRVMGIAINFLLPGFKIKEGRARKGPLKLLMGILPQSSETNIFLRNQEFQEVFLKGYLSIIHKWWPPTAYLFLPFARYENSFKNVIGRTYLERAHYPSLYLKIDFNSFAQYLKQFNSLRRNKVLRAIRRFESNGCYFEYCEKPGQYQDRLYELAKNVAQKNAHWGSPFLLGESTFEMLESKMRGQFHLVLVKKGTKIIGFSLTLKKNDLFNYLTVGLDYDYVKDAAVYFNLYYEVIRLAIKLKINRIEMGNSQTHVKRRLGCKTRQHHAFITTSYNWMTQCANLIGMVPEDRFQDLSQK